MEAWGKPAWRRRPRSTGNQESALKGRSFGDFESGYAID
jgi:hypothetical protein